MSKKYIIHLIFLVFFIPTFESFSQTSFRAIFEKNDPVPKDTSLSDEEKEKIHFDFLTKAQHARNQELSIFGNLYCFIDNLHQHDYVAATSFLLAAEKIAVANENFGWLGFTNYQKGNLNLRMDKEENALAAFRIAAQYCGQAGDSLCFGESLEQMSAMLSYFDKPDSAKICMDLALPLLRKFGEQKQMASAYSNYAVLLMRQKKYDEAIPLMTKAADIFHEQKNYRSELKCRNNVANILRKSGKPDLAIEKFKECIELNKKHGFLENMTNNYLGLYFIYYKKENYKLALENISEFEHLKD